MVRDVTSALHHNVSLTPMKLHTLTNRVFSLAALATAAIALIFFTLFVSQVRADSHLPYFQIWSIEPAVSETTAAPGSKILISVNTFNQDEESMNNDVDSSVHDDFIFRWIGVGDFSEPRNIPLNRKSGRPDDRTIEYRVPYSPGTYTVIATLRTPDICANSRTAGCTGRITAAFAIKVATPTRTTSVEVAPKDPDGVIPAQITASDGTAYAVAVPSRGGYHSEGNASAAIPTGAVSNDTFVGFRISEAVNIPTVPPTVRQRVTVAPESYNVDIVNSTGEQLLAYRLTKPATVCLPTPVEFRPYLSDIILVEGITNRRILTSEGQFDSELGWRTCGNTSTLPGTFTVAVRGDHPNLMQPTPEPTPDATIATLSVGGRAPLKPVELWAVTIALLAGATVATVWKRAQQRRDARQDHPRSK